MSDPSFAVHSSAHGATTVAMCGRLDRAGVARLRSELAQWREAGVRDLYLDLSGVNCAEPGVARMLTWARIQWRGRETNLIVTGASAVVRARLATEVAALESALGVHSNWPAERAWRPETAEQPR